MTSLAWAVLTLAGVFLIAALGDLVSEEIRGWLDLAPRAILRLAATQLDPAQRETIYQDEWLPELLYALRGAEARPVTRLIRGTTYATGILIASRRIARRLTRSHPSQQATTAPANATRVPIPNSVLKFLKPEDQHRLAEFVDAMEGARQGGEVVSAKLEFNSTKIGIMVKNGEMYYSVSDPKIRLVPRVTA